MQQQTDKQNNDASSSKTVFLLDRNEYFTRVSSSYVLDSDIVKDDSKQTNITAKFPPIPPLDRSMWTCTVEAVVGYSRLVWDLFSPEDHLVSVLSLLPKNNFEQVCSWASEDQNLTQFMAKIAKNTYIHQLLPNEKLVKACDMSKLPPDAVTANLDTILNGLGKALDQLSRLSEKQLERLSESNTISEPYISSPPGPRSPNASESGDSIENQCRIILITTLANGDQVKKIATKFKALLNDQNSTIAEISPSHDNESKRCPIDKCELVIINTYALEGDFRAFDLGEFNIHEHNLSIKAFSVKSGKYIAGLLNNLCLEHYNLKSTTIMGIPMKEEQSAGTSCQYNVEIVHSAFVHDEIADLNNVDRIDRNGFICDTFKLHWCSPRTQALELQHCVATSRLTAVDVNSRPSQCLTNFLLNGRTVMLEIFKSKSSRQTTHFLAAHNGILFIHTLPSSNHKQSCDDSPSISEATGSKVTDYRLTEFVEFMKSNTLVFKPSKKELDKKYLDKVLEDLKCQTAFWPLTHSLKALHDTNQDANGDERVVKGSKRPVSKLMKPVNESPLKKQKQVTLHIPEINIANPSLEETAVYYRSGVSLMQTWFQLNELANKDEKRPEFAGRSHGHIYNLYE